MFLIPRIGGKRGKTRKAGFVVLFFAVVYGSGCEGAAKPKPAAAARQDMAPWMTRNPGEKLPIAPSEGSNVSRSTDPSLAPFRADAASVLPPSPRAGGRAGWSITIFSTTNAEAARDVLHAAKTRAGLADAYAELRGKVIVVALGDYPSPTDPKARAEVDRVRAIKIDAAFPFERAVLSPPPADRMQGSAPEFNLANVRSSPGMKWALYTLQIGAYAHIENKAPTAKELAEFRKAAEAAVIQLRREGEEAFYYHGPNRSSVTVGLFGEKDFDVRSAGVGDSPTLRGLRQKYPYNLVNGATYKVKLPGQNESREQPSKVVVVPD